MNFIDYLIIVFLAVIVGIIIYFCFWKNRKQLCHGCPYAKNCKTTKCSSKPQKTK